MVDAINDKILKLLGVLALDALQLRSRSIYMHNPTVIGIHNPRLVNARPATRDQTSCHRLNNISSDLRDWKSWNRFEGLSGSIVNS